MTVTLDLIDNTDLKRTSDGYELSRTAIVTGMTGSGHSRLYNAVNDVAMPNIGDSHPAVSSATLKEISTTYVDSETVKFKLTYRSQSFTWQKPFVANAIQVGSSVVQTQTNKDRTGVDFSLTYTYPTGYQRSPHDTATTEAKEITQGATATLLAPQLRYSVQKIEFSSPESTAANYVGKVNSSGWRGYAARTWLCTNISGYSDDGGATFNTTYEFQYNPDTWNVELVFIKDDGKPPSTTDANSKKTYSIYNEANFGAIA